MTKNGTNGHAETPDSLGDYGGGVSQQRVSLETTRMLERAVREQWPIPDKYREAIVNRQVAIAIDLENSPREATAAARCLSSMNGQNLAAAQKALDKIAPDQHEVNHTNDELRALVEQIRHDDAYIDQQYRRASDSDAHAGAHGGNGKQRPLANGSAPGADRPEDS